MYLLIMNYTYSDIVRVDWNGLTKSIFLGRDWLKSNVYHVDLFPIQSIIK